MCNVRRFSLLALLLGLVPLPSHSVTNATGDNANIAMQQNLPPIPEAAEFGARSAGTPCRVINAIGKKLIYHPPGLDRPVLVLNSCTSTGRGSAIFVDFLKGKSTVVPLPSGSGGWDIIEVEPGKLLFESLEPLSLITIDTTNGDYKVVSDVPVPENVYGWSFTKGPQGEIYFGSYPTAHLYRYDPKSRDVKDLGYIGPEGNLYVRNVAYEANGYVICDVMVSKPALVAYELATGKQTVVAPGVSSTVVPVGGKVYAAIDNVVHQFDAASMKFVPADLPPAPNNLKWRFMSPASTPERMLLVAEGSNWYEIVPGAAPRLVCGVNLRGGGLVDFVGKDKVMAFQGQEYALADAPVEKLEWRKATDDAVPLVMHFLSADPEGGVTGGPNFGQTLFRFDPARKLDQGTGQVVSGGGEVYDGKWVDGKFHFVSYSGGYQAVWDPRQPWDQWNNVNPKTLLQYNTDEYEVMIRPIGGVVTGPGGKLYSGWSGTYGKMNGGLIEFDPATNTARRWSNEIFAHEMSIGKVVTDGKYIYGLTSNMFSGILPEQKPLSFWVFDPATEKVLYKQQMKMVVGANVFCVPDTNRIWLADASGVHGFDAAKMEFTRSMPWPAGIGAVTDVNSADSRGNGGWMATDTFIVKLTDGNTPRLDAQFKMKVGANIAAGYDGKLYFTQGYEVWTAPLR